MNTEVFNSVVNDRNTLNRDSAETEASARSTEASAESLPTNCQKLCKKLVNSFKNWVHKISTL